MPNRLIRDGLLESEAVLSLTIEARWLYIAICLTADDMGLFEATEFKLARRADLKREHIERLLSMLNDVDLIRLYSDDKKNYGIIPKFKQRLQIKRIKYPIPPEQLYLDDNDAIEKFNKLRQLASKTTVVQRMGSGCVTDAQPPEPEPEPEPEPKHKKHITPSGVSDSIFKDFLEVRKAKKAKWTETALKGLQREAVKANMTLEQVMQMCCERGWAGFKAEWAETAKASLTKELPLATPEQIEHAYKVEVGADPSKARFNSYNDMRKFIQDFRDKSKRALQ